ncbi:unnamed protein product [Sphagnum compactum]
MGISDKQGGGFLPDDEVESRSQGQGVEVSLESGSRMSKEGSRTTRSRGPRDKKSRNTLASNKFGIAGAYKEYVFCSFCAAKGVSHRKRERRNHAENEGARRRRVTDHAFREKMDIPLLQGYNDWFFLSP